MDEKKLERDTILEEEIIDKKENTEESEPIKSYSEKLTTPYEPTLNDFLTISKNFYAGFWLRFLAFVIDVVLVGSLSELLNTLTFGVLDYGENIFATGKPLLWLVTYSLYFVTLTYMFNQTLGKMIVGISVESNDRKKLTLSDVFMREIVGRFLITVLYFIPYLIVPFMRKKKGLNDFIADTVVVKDSFSTLREKLNLQLKQ